MYLEALSYTCHLTYPPPPPPHLTTHPQHIINTHQMSPSSGRTCLYLHEFADVLAAIHGAGRSAKLDGHFRPQQHHCFEVVGLGLLLTMLYALLSLHLPPPPPHRLPCTSPCPWTSQADWCLQSDVTADPRLQADFHAARWSHVVDVFFDLGLIFTNFHAFLSSMSPHTRCVVCST